MDPPIHQNIIHNLMSYLFNLNPIGRHLTVVFGYRIQIVNITLVLFINLHKTFIPLFIVCGGSYYEEPGIIQSTNYPHSYAPERNCDFYIQAPLGKAIILDFMDFDLEEPWSSDDCEYDYLAIYDGIKTNNTKVGSFCGTTIPERIISTINYMHLILVSDGMLSGRGFKANFTFFDICKLEFIIF